MFLLLSVGWWGIELFEELKNTHVWAKGFWINFRGHFNVLEGLYRGKEDGKILVVAERWKKTGLLPGDKGGKK